MINDYVLFLNTNIYIYICIIEMIYKYIRHTHSKREMAEKDAHCDKIQSNFPQIQIF